MKAGHVQPTISAGSGVRPFSPDARLAEKSVARRPPTSLSLETLLSAFLLLPPFHSLFQRFPPPLPPASSVAPLLPSPFFRVSFSPLMVVRLVDKAHRRVRDPSPSAGYRTKGRDRRGMAARAGEKERKMRGGREADGETVARVASRRVARRILEQETWESCPKATGAPDATRRPSAMRKAGVERGRERRENLDGIKSGRRASPCDLCVFFLKVDSSIRREPRGRG